MYKLDQIRNKILQGDAIQILKKIPNESIDLVITDPPYKISQKEKKIVRNLAHYKWKRKSDIELDFGGWDRQWKTDKEYFLWVEAWFKEIVRILKKGSWLYIFFDKQKIGIFDLWLAPKYNLKSRTIFTWVKTNPVPSFRKVNWNSGTEFIWVGSKGNGKIKNFLRQKEMSNYFLYPNASAWKKTNHPTEKPEKLIEKIILTNSNQKEIILDPFMGSGVTGVVAKKLGRDFIGIELNSEYVKMSKKWINSTPEPLLPV